MISDLLINLHLWISLYDFCTFPSCFRSYFANQIFYHKDVNSTELKLTKTASSQYHKQSIIHNTVVKYCVNTTTLSRRANPGVVFIIEITENRITCIRMNIHKLICSLRRIRRVHIPHNRVLSSTRYANLASPTRVM